MFKGRTLLVYNGVAVGAVRGRVGVHFELPLHKIDDPVFADAALGVDGEFMRTVFSNVQLMVLRKNLGSMRLVMVRKV